MTRIGYIRTSRADQQTSNQRIALEAEGIQPHLIFVDAGISGAVRTDDRPGWKALLEYINGHQVDVILVFEVSRIGRSFIDTLQTVLELEDRGIKVWSLSPAEAWSRIEDASMRKLILSVFSWAAERERQNLRERTKAGQARALKEGKRIGPPFRDLPISKIKALRKQGHTIAAIARFLNIPYATLYRRKDEFK